MKKKQFFGISLSLALLLVLGACAPVTPSSSLEESSSEQPSEPESSEEPSSEEVSSEDSSEPETSPFGLSITMPEGRAMKIMQFADIHFGQASKAYHNDKVSRTKEYMQYLVDTVNPDLIVCTGDNIMTTGVNGLRDFVELLDSYETPWAFIYGNHDAESTATKFKKSALSNYFLTCGSEYLLYEEDYIDEVNNRYGNYVINVLDPTGEKLQGSIILMDAGVYDYDLGSYESITQGQIDWYDAKIDELNALYQTQTNKAHDIIPSIVFSHIQLPEFYDVTLDAINGDGASFVIEQDLSETQISEVQSGAPTKETTEMYAKLVEKGSTKAYFVGHAHTFKFQVKDNEDGIVLGFGPQTGFSRTFEDNDLARTNFTYNLNADFTFDTTETKEDATGRGLGYGGTFEGFAPKNSSGEYQFRLTFSTWNRIVFSYDGIRMKLSDFAEITGEYVEGGQAHWDTRLYSTDGIKLIYSGSKETEYVFTYTPTTNILDIKLFEKPNIDDDPADNSTLEPDTINEDAGADSLAVWTTPGIKFKTQGVLGSTWHANGWRYYVIFDAEGKICYAVQNPPNGYGGPSGDGYYRHPDYADYTKNPAINILEGYGPWDPDNKFPSGQFEIVIPEGGFAITGHGFSDNLITNMLSNGEVTDYSDANVNRFDVYSEHVRVSYDKENNLLKCTYGE